MSGIEEQIASLRDQLAEVKRERHEFIANTQAPFLAALRQRQKKIEEELKRLVPGHIQKQREDRRRKIWDMRQGGATLREIGDEFGITRDRVRQVIDFVERRDERRKKR